MTNAFTRKDFDSPPSDKDVDRFNDFAKKSPTDLCIHLHIRLVPKLHEFEEAKSKDGKSWVVQQLRRWLTAFQRAFNTLIHGNYGYDGVITDRNWQTATAHMCKKEVAERHDFITWARGTDSTFEYKEYAAVLDYFGMPRSDVYNFQKTYLPYKNDKLVECHKDGRKEVQDEFEMKLKEITGYLDTFYREKELSFVLQRTTTELTRVWKEEALALFNTAKFADQERIFMKHGEELCGQSHIFSKFIDKINAEKEDSEQQRLLNDKDNSSKNNRSEEIGSTTNGDESADANHDNSHNMSKEQDGNSSTGREESDGNQNNSLNNDVGAYSI